MTLLGAEDAPRGSLGEATALLDWGFALPPDAGVGRLVAPGEVTPVEEEKSSSAPVAGLLLGAALVLTALVALAVWWRTGPRRRPGHR